ncbi:MAG: hypothetical protein ACOC44_02415 [Promethearchaeia archaeon]
MITLPKFKKKTPAKKKKKYTKKEQALKTVKIAAILSGICLFFSMLFNAEIITFFMNKGLTWDIVDVAIKTGIILLFFIFTLISIGNYKDITGKPITLKEVLLVFGLSLIQTINNLWVLLFTLLGIPLIMLYFYLVQE